MLRTGTKRRDSSFRRVRGGRVKRLVRLIIIVVAAAVAVPPVGFFVYDLVVFQPRLKELDALLAHASAAEREPSTDIQRLVEASNDGHVSTLAARLLVRRLHIPAVVEGEGGWHLTTGLWSTLVALHLPRERQVAVVVSWSYMGNDRYGYSSEAVARYGRSLSVLSLDELATVVALNHAPEWYSSSPERLAKRRDWLLSRIREGL